MGTNRNLGELLTKPVPVHWLISIFVVCLGLGHLQMMMAVNFDFFAMIDAFMAMLLLASLYARRPIGRFAWPWFVLLSLLGGLGFSLPLYWWLNSSSARSE